MLFFVWTSVAAMVIAPNRLPDVARRSPPGNCQASARIGSDLHGDAPTLLRS
jgi:hypothetical protein